jgi:hypothetical protein
VSNNQRIGKTRRRRSFPFYKVQVFEVGLGTWKDEHKAFDTLTDAEAYLKNKNLSQIGRIVRIEEKSRSVLPMSSIL